MGDLPDTLNRLATRLETLEQRVYALEHPAVAPSLAAVQEPSPQPVVESGEALSASIAVGAFPVLGKAMLGIAGAYLLRAMAESSALPRAAVAAVAIAYAMAWLVWASRAKTGDWLTGTTYVCTSALILAPMLWELTLRFKVLPAPATAGVIGAFAIATTALEWKRSLASVVWVANVTAAAITLALLLATRELIPFIAVLLLMVLISECQAILTRESGVRVVVALAADVSVWALIYIYASPQDARNAYPQVGAPELLAPGPILFLIVGASLIYRTVVKRKKITVFDTIENMIAFLLAACSLVYLGPPASATALGIVCVALAGACYATAFLHFDGAHERRNSLVFATWSGALFLAGSLLCLPPMWRALWLGAAALTATFAGARSKRLALVLHGLVFLLVAAAISGFLSETFNALAGTPAWMPAWSGYVVSACAVFCYAALRPCRERSWMQQGLSLVFATLAIGAVAALLVQRLMALIALSVIPGVHHLAFIRTLTVCVAAIALAFSGTRWQRMELTKIGYAALGLLAIKLVLEDLRHGHLAFTAGSIFLFAITLIAVPRVARLGQRV